MSITEGEDGKVLWHCMAGCPQEALTAILSPSGGKREGWDASKAEAVYDYVDEQGSLLFQVCRMAGKEFPARHRNADGDWQWNLTGVRRVPYNLPGLIQAVKDGKWIVIVEGEKDADAGNASTGDDYFFTCNPGGAGKWRQEYTKFFAKARVIIWTDNDGPGYSHARRVRKSLASVVTELHVVQALDGKDAYDHLVKNELPITLVVAIDLPEEDEVRLSEIESKSVDWHLKPFVQVGAFHLLAGDGGIGKGSWLAHLTALVTTGRTEHSDEPQNVLIIASEDSTEIDLRPRVLAAGGDPSRVFVLQKHLLLPRDIEYLEEKIEQQRNGAATGVVVIDPIANHIGGASGDDESSVRKAINELNFVAERTGCAIFGVRHITKSDSVGVKSVLGSVAWVNSPRVILMLERLSSGSYDTGSRVLKVVKSNRGQKGAQKHYTLTGVQVPGVTSDVPLIVPDGATVSEPSEKELVANDPWYIVR